MISEYHTALEHIAAGHAFSDCGWDEEESLDVIVRQLFGRLFSDDQPA